MNHGLHRAAALVVAGLVLALTASVASADGPGWETVSQDVPGPPFGINVARNGEDLLVAAGAGPAIIDPETGEAELIAEIEGLSDVVQTGPNEYYVLTGGDERAEDPVPCPLMALCKVKNGNVSMVADIYEWELANDPDGSGNVPGEDSISNPFDLVPYRGKFLVADAGGNNIQLINKGGKIELIAVLPYQDIDTQPVKDLFGCPAAPEFICELPSPFTIDPVATSVALGPDGSIYAGELAGFPGPQNASRVWKIDPKARGEHCGDSDLCTQVDGGPFTSIIDLTFGPDGTAYVLELDEAGWFAGEFGMGVGGTVNACQEEADNGDVTWDCEVVVSGLPFPTAMTTNEDGEVFLTILPNGFDPPWEVIRLTGED